MGSLLVYIISVNEIEEIVNKFYVIEVEHKEVENGEKVQDGDGVLEEEVLEIKR